MKKLSKATIICLGLMLLTSPSYAQTDDACEEARLQLAGFLQALPHSCTRSSDCEAYELQIDACDPEVVLAKPGVPSSKSTELRRLQEAAKKACKPSGGDCAAFSKPACVNRRCVDKWGRNWSLVNYSLDVPAHAYPHALIMASCAPWDGPAIGLLLTTKPASCGKAAEGPYLSIYIWRDLPEHGPKTIEFKEGGDNGGASRCAKANECERATSGRVTFTKFDQNGEVEGSYEFHFKDGSVEQGSFNAEWCHERVMCG